jgi:hypothetical protein
MLYAENHSCDGLTTFLMKKASIQAFFVDFYIVSGDNRVSKQAFRVIFNISKEFYYASTQEKAE